jgi:hypothetical protein
MPFAVEITTTRFGMVPFYYRSIVGPESRRLRNGCRLACEEGIRAYGRDIAGFLSHLSLLRAKYLLATTAGLRRSGVPHNTLMMLQ